jgi:hypothetical protein
MIEKRELDDGQYGFLACTDGQQGNVLFRVHVEFMR